MSNFAVFARLIAIFSNHSFGHKPSQPILTEVKPIVCHSQQYFVSDSAYFSFACYYSIRVCALAMVDQTVKIMTIYIRFKTHVFKQ